MRQIVTVGGGSGHSQVLKSLKNEPEITITAICPSTDSGGSTGVLREEYEGHGYIGDLTKCVAALTPDPVFAKALSYRYGPGALLGHSMKNILFHALEEVSDLDTALSTLWRIANIAPHRVIPVSGDSAELCATLRLGNTITGETSIDTLARNPLWNPDVHAITDIYLKPHIEASKAAVEAISSADVIIICPGDLYSSIIPTLLPKGIRETIASSSATIVIVLNIMTKCGETDAYTANDFVQRIEDRLGRSADRVICNSAPIPERLLLSYSLESKVEMGSLAIDDPRIVLSPLATVNELDQIITDPVKLREVLKPIVAGKVS